MSTLELYQRCLSPAEWHTSATKTPLSCTKTAPAKVALRMEQLRQVAARELRENESTRVQCLAMLREWIRQNRDIENCLLDERFLLSFLRMKKFSVPMAQQTLLKYLNFRKRFKHIMHNLDCTDAAVKEIFSKGYIFASPFRDDNGRRVILYNLSKFDPHIYSSTDMSRAHAIVYETIITDEEVQIMGVNHVGDLGGVSAALVTIWSITEFATLIRWGEQSFPMRHKEINLLNLPNALKYVYDFAQSNVKSEKLKERVTIHNSLDELKKKVNKKCLPKELGGDMPMCEMIELWKLEMSAKRDLLLTYDSMNLLSDRGIITRRNNSTAADHSFENNVTGAESLPGSFRKLEVD